VTFPVLVVGDTLYEGNETFRVTISNPSGATLGTASATGTITDDDARPVVSVGGTSVHEGNSGTASAVVTVTSSAVSGLPITVSFATSNGTATAPGDYLATTGSVTIPAGSTSTTFIVLVVGDTLYEKNETFSVALSAPVNATLGTATATGTIVDDDPVPVVSISDTTRSEGNSGTAPMQFTVSLSAVSGLAVTATYTTANGSAHAPGDYTTASGTVTVPAGSTSATVGVPVVGDSLYEGNETFTTALSTPVNATLGIATATGTVLDDDAPPVVSLGDASVAEGNSGTTTMVFTVTTSVASGLTTTVNYQTSDGSATAPGDYTTAAGTVSIPAGSTSATFSVPVVGDTLYEGNETFSVALSGPVNATLGAAIATGTILDDDAALVLSVADVSVPEGNSGTKAMVFTVTASQAGGLPMSVGYTTSDGTASAPGDYLATTGTVTIPPGQTSATFTVLVVGDQLYEQDESFTLSLSGPVNATLDAATATGTIVDDDAPPAVSVGDASAVEGDSGTAAMVFTVSTDALSALPVTVAYTTSDGSATAPGDYTTAAGTVSIPAGSTSATFGVLVKGDTLHETNETFTVNLGNPVGAAIGAGSATGTIVDDDAAPTVSVADTSVPDGGNGTTTPAVFLVTLSAPSAGPVTVDYATSDGTATQPRNYTATSGTLTIAAGSTTATFTVPVIGGMPHEGDRTFTVTLADPSGATLADPATATGTIVDEHRLGIATAAVFWSETPAEQEAELADLESMGAQWIRTTLFWRAVQPDSPDAYDWSEPDSIVAAANAHHISIIFEVIGAPLWAVPGSQPGDIYDYPPDPSQYANFVAAVAARYNPQGVTAYELGNSPNLNNTGNTPNPAFYTSLLCATYSAVKAVAPQATVMTGGLGGTRDSNGNYSGAHFVQLLYADGAKGCFDAISFHPYTFPLLAPDDGTGGWSAMLTVRQTMVANGDANKKIWATEYGAPTNGPNSNSVSEAVQAQMLDTGYRLFAGYSWSGPMCWFQYQDKGTDASVQSNFFGLIRFDGSHKPAYSTFVADAAAAIP
jgi:Calx-beta domain